MKEVRNDEWLTLYQGCALDVLRTLPDESVQCVVTSPPYDDLRTYGGTSKFDFEGIAGALFRVLAPGGVCCWNVNDQVKNGSETLTSFRQALHFVYNVGFRMLAGGTTGRAAIQNGRRAILIELNPDYIPLIEQRTHVTPGFQFS